MQRGVFLKDKLENDKVVEALKVIDSYFQDKYDLETNEVLDMIREKELCIPLSAFKNEKLSSLEIITRFLKDSGKTYHEIAVLLNRDDRTIWCTYQNSLKKQKSPLKVADSKVQVPVSLFSNRMYSVLESLVTYLKDKKNLSYNEIASALEKHYQTVWTTYRKAKDKNEE